MAEVEHSSKVHPGLDKSPKKNWIDRLPPGLASRWKSSWIRRAAKHLHYDKGMPVGRAIATAVNAAKKGCATGDLNWSGKQTVNPASRAEMCAAVATWTAMKAQAGGNGVRLSNEVEADILNLSTAANFNPGLHRRVGGKFAPKGVAKKAGVTHPLTTVELASAIASLQVGETIDLPGGKGKVKRLKEGWQVLKGDGTFNKLFVNRSDAIPAAVGIVSDRFGKQDPKIDAEKQLLKRKKKKVAKP